ncbi:hypothetical protein DCS_07098 [Drechmeria coniospora]|uniref:Uncharacterized protein n=1 Tax=Drechmeria coniospora TaxID=98403 RepID=A0A151GDG7_DRECN|nr:hypothetical protein DCS_07098 [Drechmeria coniospora]KYK55136.1 hypothetical protein DCS_07098 [Drechmeria coniospora]
MSATHVFESGFRNLESHLLENLIRAHLERALEDLDQRSPPQPFSSSNSRDLLIEMGDYFSRTAVMWGYLTDNLLNAPNLAQAAIKAHERSRTDSGMSDLSEIAQIDLDTTRLRYAHSLEFRTSCLSYKHSPSRVLICHGSHHSKIRDLGLEFSRQVQATWRPQSPLANVPPGIPVPSISPYCETKSPMSSKSLSMVRDGERRAVKARKLLPDRNSQAHVNVAQKSPDSDDSEDDMFPHINMEALRQRGKGSYSCPKSYQCRKGGVDRDGNLVIFDRNSSFAYVVTAVPLENRALRGIASARRTPMSGIEA